MHDSVGPGIAKILYQHLYEDPHKPLNPDTVAFALDKAVEELRTSAPGKDMLPSIWAPFIHIGLWDTASMSALYNVASSTDPQGCKPATVFMAPSLFDVCHLPIFFSIAWDVQVAVPAHHWVHLPCYQREKRDEIRPYHTWKSAAAGHTECMYNTL